MCTRLIKRVKVSDPDMWYQENEVDVQLYVTPAYKGTVQVKILVSSIDDFAVSYIQECNEKYTDYIRSIYDHMKKWMFDRIPEVINIEWLYEHGYWRDC